MTVSNTSVKTTELFLAMEIIICLVIKDGNFTEVMALTRLSTVKINMTQSTRKIGVKSILQSTKIKHKNQILKNSYMEMKNLKNNIKLTQNYHRKNIIQAIKVSMLLWRPPRCNFKQIGPLTINNYNYNYNSYCFAFIPEPSVIRKSTMTYCSTVLVVKKN